MFGNDSVMAEFINNLKNNPHKAYVFLAVTHIDLTKMNSKIS